MTSQRDIILQTDRLTKRFAGHLAIHQVSFEVARGEIVGFLGPNGAGKTTTMRILAGFLSASSGTARIAGYDVQADSLEVRKRIGYLPENVPLYPDMRVDEYLRFRAHLKGVPRRRVRSRMDEVRALCGLEQDGRRILGHLSKGYRQRVGLADALIGDPELLIFDEPTLGLDPNQIRSVREMIRNLASRHTILLSTHILSEVEMTCQRVLILHWGRIIASGSPDQLLSTGRNRTRVRAEIQGPREEVRAALSAIPGVQEVTAENDAPFVSYGLVSAPGTDVRADVFRIAARRGWTLRDLRDEPDTLEEIFVQLTRGAGESGET